jgi:uncharacterized phage-associated protein
MTGKSLFENDVHAWQWGPVIPKLYKALQRYGNGEVSEPIQCIDDGIIEPSSEKEEIIKAVWNAYGNFSGSKLSALTHKEGTPWSETWKKDKYGIIPIELIRDHYKQLIAA